MKAGRERSRGGGRPLQLPFNRRNECTMLFTIQTEPLIKMLEMLGDGPSHKHSIKDVICLVADRDRVFARSGQTIAESETAVWENGQCSVSRDSLVSRLKACRNETEVTIRADHRHIYVNGLSIPLTTYCHSI